LPPFDPPPLYAICDQEVCARAGWRVEDFAAACLLGGATLLQLRAKGATGRAMLAAAEAIMRLAGPVGARVIVNDRADIARLAGAHGVHVGQEDLPPAAVRLVCGDHAVVGLSTHTAAQIARGLEAAADYLAIGPVFGTSTKATGREPVGLAGVRAAAALAAARGRPLVAIGGITLDRAPDVMAAGARSLAVIGDLWVGADPAARVRQYLDLLKV
jgi:thiamine-phosphate pyrophosphorylase